jgi:hypothetical protein
MDTKLRWYRIIAERDPKDLPFARFYKEQLEAQSADR